MYSYSYFYNYNIIKNLIKNYEIFLVQNKKKQLNSKI